MSRTWSFATGFALLFAAVAWHAQPSCGGVTLGPESCVVPSDQGTADAESMRLAVKRMDILAFQRESRPLLAYLQPPKGTSQEVVEQVYGSQAWYQKDGKGPDCRAYSLGESGLELRVFYEGDKVVSSSVEERLEKGEIPLDGAGEAFTTDKLPPHDRKLLTKYQAAVTEFDEKLRVAPWNCR